MTCACPLCGAALAADQFAFDAESGIVVAGGQFVSLPHTEALVLEKLLEQRGRVVRKDVLFRAVYSGRDGPDDERVVETHVSKLRKKIRPLGLVIQSERFKGYTLVMETANG